MSYQVNITYKLEKSRAFPFSNIWNFHTASKTELVSDEYTYGLLHSGREAHMNMVRVWGGGIYESDAFYDACDELGLLVWQDHMFACSMYQVNQENLETADRESKTQVRRLQHHASVALWAGNNENEAALVNNWFATFVLEQYCPPTSNLFSNHCVYR